MSVGATETVRNPSRDLTRSKPVSLQFETSKSLSRDPDVSGKFDNWGTAIKSYGGTPRPALQSTKPVKPAGNISRPKTIARSNSTPTVAKPKSTSTISKATLPSTSSVTGTAAGKPTPLRPAAKAQSKPGQQRVSSQPPQPSNIKYTPGVLTGMPGTKLSTTKRAAPSNKPKEQANKQPGGELKYTPGKLTGMPTQGGVKSSRPTNAITSQSRPPMKKADSASKGSKKGPGERIDRTFF
jgi:hypothetical protein